MAVVKETAPDSAGSGVDQIEVLNPVTNEVIGTIARTSREDVQAAVEHAREAQPSWAAMSVKERSRIIRRWGDMLWEDQRDAMRIIRQETGKNDTGAFLEVIVMSNTINYYVHHAPKILRPQKRPAPFPLIQRAKVYYKPHGVVGLITPWNYPFVLALSDGISALLAGNTIVLKPSEITPYSVLYGIELLHKAGVPEDAAQVVTGDGSTGAALVDCVDYICFTGSTAVGRKVAVRASERLIPYSLELGGKDAMIILKDADLELAASSVLMAACENAGQMCISTERIYVEAPIYDKFVDRVRHYAEQLTIGPGDGFDVDVGSLTNERELLRAEEHIRDALDKGAELIYGGQRRPDLGPLFFEPAVLANVNHSMKLMQEETFGPLVPIMCVADEEEAVRMANDSPYGLSGTIFTRDLKRGERLATRIDTGDISVNRHGAVASAPNLPWGGEKESGIGRRNGPEGLTRFTTTQSIIIDTRFAEKPTVRLLDPVTLTFLKAMRKVRRILPFI